MEVIDNVLAHNCGENNWLPIDWSSNNSPSINKPSASMCPLLWSRRHLWVSRSLSQPMGVTDCVHCLVGVIEIAVFDRKLRWICLILESIDMSTPDVGDNLKWASMVGAVICSPTPDVLGINFPWHRAISSVSTKGNGLGICYSHTGIWWFISARGLLGFRSNYGGFCSIIAGICHELIWIHYHPRPGRWFAASSGLVFGCAAFGHVGRSSLEEVIPGPCHAFRAANSLLLPISFCKVWI
jgi:hypothetical protein